MSNVAVKGKHGYYPCNVETYRKLKYLHRSYWQAVYDTARWVRWDRKTVNKTGAEPVYCPIFVESKSHIRSKKNKEGYTIYTTYPKTINDHNVIVWYKAAKYPRTSAEEVVPFTDAQLQSINELYEAAQKWDAAPASEGVRRYPVIVENKKNQNVESRLLELDPSAIPNGAGFYSAKLTDSQIRLIEPVARVSKKTSKVPRPRYIPSQGIQTDVGVTSK